MPYILPEEKKSLDPEISTVLRKLLVENALVTRKNGRYFFFAFLVYFYEILREAIARGERAGHASYHHYNALEGALGCAGKELYRRWSELSPLKVRIINWRRFTKLVDRHVPESEWKPLIALARMSAAKLDLNDTADTKKLVGEINYTVSEIANTFGNSGKASRQDLLDATVAATWHLYLDYCGPYEDKAILKNGDTLGFLKFFEQLAQS